MYTGLIQAVGRVENLIPTDRGIRLSIDPGDWDHHPENGESIAINGVCLTVVDQDSSIHPNPSTHSSNPIHPIHPIHFDAIPETLAHTTLGSLEKGDQVNLERSLRAGDLLGGHMVQGHVDGVGEVVGVRTPGGDAQEWRTTVRAPRSLAAYIAPKGSITIDGVSLTIASVDVEAGTFDVALIPTTLRDTTMSEALVGKKVNIETDIIARTTVHYLRHYADLAAAE